MKQKPNNHEFENFLMRSIKNNKVDHLQSDEVAFSEEQKRNIDITIERAVTYRRILNTAKTIDKNKTLSAFILSVRQKASLDIPTMAKTIGIETETFDSIERGTVNLKVIHPSLICKLLVSLRIKIGELNEMLKKESIISQNQPQIAQAIARSPHKAGDEREKNVKLGIDAVILQLSKKEENTKIDSSEFENLLSELKEILIKENDLELLE